MAVILEDEKNLGRGATEFFLTLLVLGAAMGITEAAAEREARARDCNPKIVHVTVGDWERKNGIEGVVYVHGQVNTPKEVAEFNGLGGPDEELRFGDEIVVYHRPSLCPGARD